MEHVLLFVTPVCPRITEATQNKPWTHLNDTKDVSAIEFWYDFRMKVWRGHYIDDESNPIGECARAASSKSLLDYLLYWCPIGTQFIDEKGHKHKIVAAFYETRTVKTERVRE